MFNGNHIMFTSLYMMLVKWSN